MILVLKVAWITYFPIEWLPGLPPELAALPRQHPASWQRVLLEEFLSDPELEIDVLVVRKQFPADIRFRWRGVTFHCLKVPSGMRALSLFWWETWRIRRLLREVRPDLVHAWGTERGAGLVASRLGRPYLLTMQGLLQWYNERTKMALAQKFEAAIEPWALRRARVVTTESSFAVRWLKEHYPQMEIRQAEHAPNWIFHRVVRNPQTQPVRFLYVGALGHIKGTDILFQGLETLRNDVPFEVIVVGGGDQAFVNQVKAQIRGPLWDRVQFCQSLTPPQIAEEMSRATMLLFPTRVDTSPNSVKEAVVAGLPVVASAVGGIVDYVVPGQNGVLCDPNNLESFAGAVRLALRDPVLGRGQVDGRTLERLRAYLSPAEMAARFKAAYLRACEGGISAK